MLNNIKGFFNIIPVIQQVLVRFPVSFIFMLLLTVFSLLLAHEIKIVEKAYVGYIYLILGFSAVAHVSFKLFVESHKWSGKQYAIGGLLLTLVISFYAVMLTKTSASSAIPFFSLALVLSWMFAPYAKKNINDDSVWFFNYQTGMAIFFAGIAAIVFGGGLSLLLVSVGYLFEIKVASILYGDIWIVTWGILFTSYVLANISKEFEFEGESCGFPKGISFIANYILVPLMFAYMAVLYAYIIKIGFQWELPKGNLGWMISVFGAIGIATKLIAYPIIRTGNKLMVLFDRYFYYALIPPVAMLFTAILIRINDYGVTEQRYAVVLLGIVFTIIILLSIIKKSAFQIKHVPMIVALLAALAAYGPWGAVEVSFNSQLQRFQLLLTKYQRYSDGKAISAKQDVSFEDRKAISSIADYLIKNKWRKKQFLPMFDDLLAEYKDKEKKPKPVNGRSLLSLINIEYTGYWVRKNNKEEYFSYTNNTNLDSTMIDITGFDYIGNQDFYLYSKEYDSRKLHLTKDLKGEYVLSEFDHNFLKMSIGKDYAFSIDLNEMLNSLRKNGIKTITKEHAHYFMFDKVSQDKKVRLRIIIEQVNGKRIKGDGYKCDRLKYILMLHY